MVVAVSTDSAMRATAEGLSTTRSTTTSMKCLIFLLRVISSPVRRTISPSMRTRANPSLPRSANSLVNSPFRPVTTGAMMIARVDSPSPSLRISSVTWSVVCFLMTRPHSGQWGTPMRANRSLR